MKEVWQSYSEEESARRKQETQSATADLSTGSSIPVFPGDAGRKVWRRNVLIGCISVGVIFWSLYFWLLRPGMTGIQVRAVVHGINNTCPKELGGVVRLDSVERLSDKLVRFNFTELKEIKIPGDTIMVQGVMKPIITGLLRKACAMQVFRTNKVTLIYLYRNLDGEYLYQTELLPNDNVYTGYTSSYHYSSKYTPPPPPPFSPGYHPLPADTGQR